MGQINARDWIFEISDQAATPVWTEIDRVTEFTLNRGENGETADLTTFQSQGIHESQAQQRGATLEITGRKVLDDAGAPDPGQDLVEQAAAKVGAESHVPIRFRHVNQTEWTQWTAHLAPGELGGGNNDMTSWAFTATRSGPATVEAVA